MPFEKEKRDFSDLFHNSSYGEPSSGRDQRGVDWHKLASLEMAELAIPCVDTGALVQDHMSYITTCDAASELDLSKAADRRSLLKLFRISQHLLRHLISSQRQQLDDLSKTKEQLAIYMEKYTESKTKLLLQIAEAKKMKENNRNLRDTVKFINSVAISKGMVHPIKCDYCPKIFREGEYLRSHIERKHMTKYNKIKHKLSPPAIATSPSVNHDNINLVEIVENCANGNDKESKELDKVCRHVHDQAQNPPNTLTTIQRQVVNTKRTGEILVHHQDESHKHHNGEPVHESFGANELFRENHQHRIVHEKKMRELEEKCTGLYEDFSVAMKKFQEERQDWNKQIVMSRNEADDIRKEKIELENHFRLQFAIMSKKIRELEGRSMIGAAMHVDIDKESSDKPPTDITLLKPGQKEDVARLDADTNKLSKTKLQVKFDDVSQLQAKLIAQKLTSNDRVENSDESSSERKFENEEACLSSITEVSAENDANNGQEDSIYDINSLPSDNEVRDGRQVRTEKLDTKLRKPDMRRSSSGSNICQVAQRQYVDDITSLKPPLVQKRRIIPSPKSRSGISPKVEKSILKPKDSKLRKYENADDELQDMMDENSNARNSSTEYVDSKKNGKDDVRGHQSEHVKEAMYESASDSGSEDTAKSSTTKEKLLPNSKRNLEMGEDIDSEVYDDETSSDENDHSQSLKKLNDVLEENPHLWKQLRQAADEVINDKLSAMEIDPNVGLSKSSYKKAIRALRSDRKQLEKKHSNFNKLRKQIHHQLKSMMKKKEPTLDMSDVKSRKTFSAFKRAGQSVKNKLNKKSDYLRKFRKVSNAAPAKISSSPGPLGRVLVCTNADASAEQILNTNTETPEGSIHKNYSSESEDDPSDQLDEKLNGDAINQPFIKPEFETVIDIHNETRQSARRNICGESLEPSETQPEDDNSVSTIQPDDDQENGIDNLAFTNDNPRESDEFLEEMEVNEEDEAEEEDVRRPPTRVGSFFQARETTSNSESDTSSHHYESQDKYEEQEYKNIKLKKATGKNILKLKANIEAQLMQRQKVKPPAGAVDIAPPGGENTTEGSVAATKTSHETRVIGFWDDSTDDELA